MKQPTLDPISSRFIHLPEKFAKEHPNIVVNLNSNVWRFTSHYDTYATLIDIATGKYGTPIILYFTRNMSMISGEPRPSLHGTSMFQLLSLDRTCADVGIKEQHCSCEQAKPLNTADARAQRAAAHAIAYINGVWLRNSI